RAGLLIDERHDAAQLDGIARTQPLELADRKLLDVGERQPGERDQRPAQCDEHERQHEQADAVACGAAGQIAPSALGTMRAHVLASLKGSSASDGPPCLPNVLSTSSSCFALTGFVM